MLDCAIASMSPGAELAAALAACDRSTLDAGELLEVMRAAQRLQSWSESLVLGAAADFANRRSADGMLAWERDLPSGRRVRCYGGSGTPQVVEFAPDEMAAELQVSPFAADRLLADGLDLRHRLPGVAAALAAGRVDGWKARLFARRTRDLSRAAAAAVENRLLPRLDRLPVRRLDCALRQAVADEDPATAARLVSEGRQGKHVWFGQHETDAIAPLGGIVSSVGLERLRQTVRRVAGLLERDPTRQARDGLPDTQDERMADALVLLADPGAVVALQERVRGGEQPETQQPDTQQPEPQQPDGLPATVVYVHMDREQLLGNAGGGARVERVGPVPVEAVRQALVHSRVTVQPVIDLANGSESSGYAFRGRTREVVVLRNPWCFFPGCHVESRGADIDHLDAAPRGPTADDNGAPACRRHHRAKTFAGWAVRQPFPAVHVWQAPTGRIYVVDERGSARLSSGVA